MTLKKKDWFGLCASPVGKLNVWLDWSLKNQLHANDLK